MIFESFWPLLFLTAVPVIIILYLLKPKGIDHLISSNLLWQKLLKNEQSKTFFEKFVHNILMYLQILIIGLLVIALMSPFIKMDGKSGTRKILLMDVSGSMQHVGKSGKTRLEEAIGEATNYVRSEENTQFSIVTCDGVNADLLAVDIGDRDELVQILQGLSASDAGGGLRPAQGLLSNLCKEGETEAALVVYTDGSGAEDFDRLEGFAVKELFAVGEATSNVANEYTVYSMREDGTYDVMLSVYNYSDTGVTLDVGLYDESDTLIALESMEIPAEDSQVCMFEGVEFTGEVLATKLSGISFVDGKKDSLAADNVSYAVKSNGGNIQGLLVGDGNTFLEKAYLAVSGEDITKAGSDAAALDEGYNAVIYDAGQKPTQETNKLLFGNPRGEAAGMVEKAMLSMANCDLTTGLSDFSIGVNEAYYFEVPEGAHSFLEYDGKCIGYYGEKNGQKEVVVGFDIRESDFPLRAEFPVFLANALKYLADTSWLASNRYYAGDRIALQPWAEADLTNFESCPKKAGLYKVGNEEYQENYVVLFRSGSESDGRKEAENVLANGEYRMEKVRKALRNLFLVLVLILLVAEWIIYVRQMRYKGWFYPAVRGLVLLCILLCIMGVKIRWGSNQSTTIFVVDLSNSNEANLSRMSTYLQKNIEKMPSGNTYGVVAFGREALVEQFVTKERNFGGLMTAPEKTSTNYEEAISRALTMIPGDSNGRIVVLTDGKETRGNIQNMAQAMTARNTEFLTCMYETEMTKDAYIDRVDMPTYLHPGDKYSVTVRVSSNYDTDAVLGIFNGSRQTSSAKVHLNKGSNRFVFSEVVDNEADSNAMESLRVQVVAEGDTCEENNVYSAYSVVESAPKVLVISGQDTNASAFASVLNAAGCDYNVVSVWNAPDTIDKMLEYKTIILANVYSDDLPLGFMDNLETYVKDYGCGFVCCGGEDSFALGGYRGTALETVLPVDMRLKSVNEKQSMAMVMVIDHSGSMTGTGMGPSNLDVAIKAATVAVDNLSDSDKVGVLTFDDQYEWQVELTTAENREKIKQEIEQISEGGGTTIKPALAEAYRAIMEMDVSVRHVVLLTDGMGETTNFDDVIAGYKGNGVTLSTVAVGDGADTALLEILAKKCGGRYYYSDVAKDIPKIFAQEVFLGGDSYIQNGNFALATKSSHEIMANLFQEGWPPLYGYVASSQKTTANVLISEPTKDAPILTIWQYGLGRSVAWNSDVTGEWTGAFSGQNDYVQMWKRIVDYAAGNASLGEDHVNVISAGETTNLIYETADYNGKTEIMTTVMGPDGAPKDVKLHMTAPGKYEAEISTPQTGLYHYNVRRMEEGEIRNYLTTASAVQFSDEYKFDVSPANYLDFVNRYGQVIDENENIWERALSGAVKKKSLANLFLALAILLFLADVAVRRFQYEPNVKKWQARFPRKREKSGVGKTSEQPTGLESVAEGAVDSNSAPTEKEKPKKELKKEPKKESKKPQNDTLDTSALLKKKDGRNI